MNLVAHQFLSFNDPALQIGNLLGENIKGKKYLDYPEAIQKGILLHRAIDTYTDTHLQVKNSSTYFHTTHHKYAPIIVDIMYDYFLIKHWNKFHTQPFQIFKENCYNLFANNYHNFPENLQFTLDHLLKYDWFENYRTLLGVEKTLKGISQRTSFPNQLDNSLAFITKYEHQLEDDFLVFFPEIITYVQDFIQSK